MLENRKSGGEKAAQNPSGQEPAPGWPPQPPHESPQGVAGPSPAPPAAPTVPTARDERPTEAVIASAPPPLALPGGRRNRSTAPGIFGVLALAAVAGVAAWFLIGRGDASRGTPPAPPGPPSRLAIFADHDEGRLIEATLASDPSRVLAVAPDGETEVPSGPQVVRVSWTRGGGSNTEIVRLALEPGRRHLLVAGGESVKVRADVGGTIVSAHGHFPSAAALTTCDHCAYLGASVSCPTCGKPTKPLPALAKLTVEAFRDFLDPREEDAALVANPYAVEMEVSVKTAAAERTFLLRGPELRAIPREGDGSIEVRATVAGAKSDIDTGKAIAPRLLSLWSIGAATCYAWKDASVVGLDESAARLAPGRLIPLSLPEGLRFHLSPDADDEHATPSLLVLRKAAGAKAAEGGAEDATEGWARLVPLASAPLLPPEVLPLGEIVAAPHVRVSEVPLPKSLGGAVVSAVATDGKGLALLVDGVVRDGATGKPLHDDDARVASLSFGPHGLVVLSRQARLASIVNRRVTEGRSVADPTLRCFARPRGDGTVFLYGGRLATGLFAVRGSTLARLLDAESEVTALAETEGGLLVARGRRVDKLAIGEEGSTPSPVVVLPEGDPIVGLLDDRGMLVFSTRDAVSALRDDVVLPLVTGIGGALHRHPDGILVHDRRTRRLFLVRTDAPEGGPK